MNWLTFILFKGGGPAGREGEKGTRRCSSPREGVGREEGAGACGSATSSCCQRLVTLVSYFELELMCTIALSPAAANKPSAASPHGKASAGPSQIPATPAPVTPKKILTKPSPPGPSLARPPATPGTPASAPIPVTANVGRLAPKQAAAPQAQASIPTPVQPMAIRPPPPSASIPTQPPTPNRPIVGYPPSPHANTALGSSYTSPIGFGPAFVNPSPQMAHNPLTPPQHPRVFGNIPGPSADHFFDPANAFQNPPPGMPSPIGPPKGIVNTNPSQLGTSPIGSLNVGFGRPDVPGIPGSTVPLRRGSIQEPVGRPSGSSFGAVQRPIAPIGRPTGSTSTATATDTDDHPPSGSSSRRSHSPTPLPGGALGSAALINDDDEPILPASGRRVGVNSAPLGQNWGAPGEPIKPLIDPLQTRSFGGWGLPPPPALAPMHGFGSPRQPNANPWNGPPFMGPPLGSPFGLGSTYTSPHGPTPPPNSS